MVIFYCFAIMDLTSRVTYLILSCFIAQKTYALLLVQGISTVASLAAGVSHSHNLTNLIFNLASVTREGRTEAR